MGTQVFGKRLKEKQRFLLADRYYDYDPYMVKKRETTYSERSRRHMPSTDVYFTMRAATGAVSAALSTSPLHFLAAVAEQEGTRWHQLNRSFTLLASIPVSFQAKSLPPPVKSCGALDVRIHDILEEMDQRKSTILLPHDSTDRIISTMRYI